MREVPRFLLIATILLIGSPMVAEAQSRNVGEVCIHGDKKDLETCWARYQEGRQKNDSQLRKTAAKKICGSEYAWYCARQATRSKQNKFCSGKTSWAREACNDLEGIAKKSGDLEQQQKIMLTRCLQEEPRPSGIFDSPSDYCLKAAAIARDRKEPKEIGYILALGCTENKDPELCFRLGLHEDEVGDQTTAHVFLREMCERPDPKACLYLSMLRISRKTKIEETKATLSDLCFPKSKPPESHIIGQACYLLGRLYSEEGNFDAAGVAHQSGCNAGFGSCCTAKGTLMGLITPNSSAAAAMLDRGCRLGDSGGCFARALVDLSRQDVVSAKKYYVLGCDRKDPASCYGLSRMEHELNHHSESAQLKDKAKVYAKSNCEQGDQTACSLLNHINGKE
jgi:TPR repeat protein